MNNPYLLYALLFAAGIAVRHFFPQYFGGAVQTAGPRAQKSESAPLVRSPGDTNALVRQFWNEVDDGLKLQLEELMRRYAAGLLQTTASAAAAAQAKPNP